MPLTKYNPDCLIIPPNNYWDQTAALSQEQIATTISTNTSTLIANASLLNAAQVDDIKNNNPNPTPASKNRNSNTTVTKLPDNKEIVFAIQQKLKPIAYQDFYGTTHVAYCAKPLQAIPTLTLGLHANVCSYLGDYGAGKTVKTFSLLPGEKTTISIRNYQHREVIQKKAEHLLDSFSESSAKELENALNTEANHNITNTSNIVTTNSFGAGAGGSAAADLTSIVGFPLSVGYDA